MDRLRGKTTEARRAEAQANESAEWYEADARTKYQREIEAHWLLLHPEMAEGWVEEDEWVYVGGFLEPRRASCHCGRGDPDYKSRFRR
jgi:hypothetical protein